MLGWELVSTNELTRALRARIVVFDGAMGTMIQAEGLDESAFRGQAFASHPSELRGCNDLLSLTQPALIERIHTRFLEAGADIVSTNTFGANRVALADYGLVEHAREMNVAAARVARAAVDAMNARTPDRPRFVAGSMGPTTKLASLSPDVNDPGARAVTFAELVDTYYEEAAGLIEGGVDLLLPETATDTLNMKAALFAVQKLWDEGARRVPLFSSVTIPDKSGRTLSGQTPEAFYTSVAHAPLTAVGINCALGADDMRPYVEEMARVAPIWTFCYPNAGLPNELGEYDDTPAHMARILGEFARDGLVNLVGGCCGTTPDHISAIADAVAGLEPRTPAEPSHYTTLSGLEPLVITPESNFTMIGERTNVAGSRKFKRLILEGQYEEALEVALQQVQGGANIIDVCMDEAMLDAEAAMVRFLNLIAAEPDIARVPVMIDSSKFSVIEAGLACLQGKGVVNSLSLKEGEEAFLRQARLVRRYGAAVVVMGFDEGGQATTVEHRVQIAERAHRLLTEEVGFPSEDIIFDPNILTVATGIEEHNGYAVAFIEATRRIKRLFPRAKISGGVSNISFSFVGNNRVREAMHAAFLYHAIRAGLDMAIVNAGQLEVYEEIPAELRERVEDVLLDRRPDATERMIELAESYRGGTRAVVDAKAWREGTLQERLSYALLHGTHEFVNEDIAEALKFYDKPLDIIEGPLMDGMSVVGELFGAGKMFLPQVVKSARVMKKAVAILEPLMEAERASSGAKKGVIVMATVKGDVHDIGKNIVGVVLRCNGYEVIDLGVMVPARDILDTAIESDAGIVGLSGLITPSLEEMIGVAREMQRRGMELPLLIGGATTSTKHTAVKIAPAYQGITLHVRDASLAANVVGRLFNPALRTELAADNADKQESLRSRHSAQVAARTVLPIAEARARRTPIEFTAADVPAPRFTGLADVAPSVNELVPWIDWSPFFHAWELKGTYPAILEDPHAGEQARKLLDDGRQLLEEIAARQLLRPRGVYGFFPAASDGDDLAIFTDESRQHERARLYLLRQQQDKHPCFCLADFVAPTGSGIADHIGAFAVQAGEGLDELVARFEADHDDYSAILAKALADRLAEAFAEMLHKRARDDWGYGGGEGLEMAELLAEGYRGIRPAFGYPACPDHSEKPTLFALLDAEARAGVHLTEGMAMLPTAAVSGIYLAHPEARYFSVGRLGLDQIEDYARRKGISREQAERWLATNLAY